MPATHSPTRRALALTLSALALSASLAGCLGEERGEGDWSAEAPEHAAAAADTAGWQVGNWWGYHATFENDVTIDIALVAFEAHDESFRLGSNLSAGFFGLPFNGNVTRPHLNPVVGGEEWRLYDFPLEDGKTWDYPLFGYTLTATARTATVTAPGVGEHPGFVLEATSFGRLVARYTYSPVTEWFTDLTIYEPTDGHEVVHVNLTGFGESYLEDYFVSVPVHAFTADYPSVPERGRFTVEGSFLKLSASVVLAAKVGDFRFGLEDPRGRVVMEGEVRPQGVYLDSKTLDAKPGAWRIDHLGLGDGALRVEVTGVQAARQGKLTPPADVDAESLDRLSVHVPHIFWGLGAVTREAPAPPAPAPDLPGLESGVRVASMV